MRDALGAPALQQRARAACGSAGSSLLRPFLLLRRSLSSRRRAASAGDNGYTTTTPRACPPRPPLPRTQPQPPPRRASKIAAAGRETRACADAADAANAAPPTAIPAPPLSTLDDQHLARFLARHCPEARIVPRDSLTEEQERRHVVKSIVLSAKGIGPILAVARLDDRLDERQIAAHLGLSRRAVRLSTAAEALEWGGFVVGTVPPLGHRTPLRTLVDAGVTRAGYGDDACVFGGGGREGMEMRVPLRALLRASCAEVGAFAKAGGASDNSSSSTSSGDEEDGSRPPAATGRGSSSKAAQAPPPSLPPMPWPPGSDFVRLVATVSSRRRVARLLMFATLAPEEEERGQQRQQHQQGGQRRRGKNSHGGGPPLSRPWARPDANPTASETSGAVEVQVIAGKTLERALGADALARLLASVRPGCVVAVTGRVQQQPILADETGDSPSPAPSSPTTLDVVACELEVLHASVAERDAALRAAEASAGLGAGSLRSARNLMALRRVVAMQQDDDTDGGKNGGGASFARTLALGGGGAEGEEEAEMSQMPLTPPPEDDAGPDGGQWYRMPLDEASAVVLVDDVAGVEACAAALRTAEYEQQRRWEQEEKEADKRDGGNGDGPFSSRPLSSRFLLSQRAAVVGIDAEWAPFGTPAASSSPSSSSPTSSEESDAPPPASSSRARSPVALLQIALRDCVFLLDLLALCTVPPSPQDGRSPPFTPPPPQPLTPAERAVDALLSDLLSSPWLVKCGFGLQHDLRRVAESYPRLPLFAPAPREGEGDPAAAVSTAAPIASHVDLPLLARAVLPALAYKAPAAASARPLGPVPSLSRLCEAALGGGTRLDKRQQRSAWEARPLSPAQVRYAAADAHVLTAVFDALVRRAAFMGKEGGSEDAGAAVRALDGGLRRVPRAKPPSPPAVVAGRRL